MLSNGALFQYLVSDIKAKQNEELLHHNALHSPFLSLYNFTAYFIINENKCLCESEHYFYSYVFASALVTLKYWGELGISMVWRKGH